MLSLTNSIYYIMESCRKKTTKEERRAMGFVSNLHSMQCLYMHASDLRYIYFYSVSQHFEEGDFNMNKFFNTKPLMVPYFQRPSTRHISCSKIRHPIQIVSTIAHRYACSIHLHYWNQIHSYE